MPLLGNLANTVVVSLGRNRTPRGPWLGQLAHRLPCKLQKLPFDIPAALCVHGAMHGETDNPFCLTHGAPNTGGRAEPFPMRNQKQRQPKMRVGPTTVRTGVARLAVVACLAVALGAAVAAPVQQAIAIGPYVQNVGKNNATICWATRRGEVTVAAPGQNDATFREYETHAVALRGLKAGTTYTYTVAGDTGATGRCTFTTVPEGVHAFSFAVISDTQNRSNAAHRPLIERILAGKPDLLFNVGDLVSDGHNIGDWEEFFRVEGDLLRSVPLYAVLGNHDRASPLYFQFFALPGNERYYSFDRGAAHFVVFDSPGLYPPEDNQSVTQTARTRFEERREQYWQEQMQWLKDDLAGHQDAKYIFVFFHYPLYSVKASRVETSNALRARFGSVLQDHKVTAVFSGHDHHYHRAVAGGVHLVGAGAAGGAARPIDGPPHPETVKTASVESFMRVDIGPNEARVCVTDVAGNTVDEFALSPRPQPSPVAK